MYKKHKNINCTYESNASFSFPQKIQILELWLLHEAILYHLSTPYYFSTVTIFCCNALPMSDIRRCVTLQQNPFFTPRGLYKHFERACHRLQNDAHREAIVRLCKTRAISRLRKYSPSKVLKCLPRVWFWVVHCHGEDLKPSLNVIFQVRLYRCAFSSCPQICLM